MTKKENKIYENSEGVVYPVDSDMALQKASESAGEWLHPIEPYGSVAAVKEITRRIMAMDTGKVPMKGAEASLLAEVAITTQLNPFDGEIWGWVTEKNDKRKLTIMPGRRGLLRHARNQASMRGFEFREEYIEIRDAEEKQFWGYTEDDLVVEARIYDTASTEDWRKTIDTLASVGIKGKDAIQEAGKRPYVSGIGVLTVAERADLDRYSPNKMVHMERTRKRAFMSALKKKFDLPFGGGSSTDGQTMEDYIYVKPPRLSEENSDMVVDAEFTEEGLKDPFGLAPEDAPTNDQNLRARRKPNYWTQEILAAVMEAGFAKNEFHASARLAYSQLRPNVSPLFAALWVGVYEGVKGQLVKDGENWSAEEIASAADTLYVGLPGVMEELETLRDDIEADLHKKKKAKKKAKTKKKTAKKKTKAKSKPKRKTEAQINEELGYG